MMAAVGSSFFAAQDDPAPGIRSFAWWSIVGIAVVAVYLFVVLPRISPVEMLFAMLAPPFVVLGILIARPAMAFIGMALAITTATLLARQSTYSADFAAFINSSVSFVIGLTTVIGIYSIMKVMRINGLEGKGVREQSLDRASKSLPERMRTQGPAGRTEGTRFDREAIGCGPTRFAHR